MRRFYEEHPEARQKSAEIIINNRESWEQRNGVKAGSKKARAMALANKRALAKATT